jgi:hypothetical protein
MHRKRKRMNMAGMKTVYKIMVTGTRQHHERESSTRHAKEHAASEEKNQHSEKENKIPEQLRHRELFHGLFAMHSCNEVTTVDSVFSPVLKQPNDKSTGLEIIMP